MQYFNGTHVEFVKSLGYPPKLVHDLVSDKYRRDGRTFRTYRDLLAAVQKWCEDHEPEPATTSQAGLENQKLGLCPSCRQQQISHMVAGCGHLNVCGSCAFLIKNCPTCFEPIRGVMKVYLVDDNSC